MSAHKRSDFNSVVTDCILRFEDKLKEMRTMYLNMCELAESSRVTSNGYKRSYEELEKENEQLREQVNVLKEQLEEVKKAVSKCESLPSPAPAKRRRWIYDLDSDSSDDEVSTPQDTTANKEN